MIRLLPLEPRICTKSAIASNNLSTVGFYLNDIRGPRSFSPGKKSKYTISLKGYGYGIISINISTPKVSHCSVLKYRMLLAIEVLPLEPGPFSYSFMTSSIIRFCNKDSGLFLSAIFQSSNVAFHSAQARLLSHVSSSKRILSTKISRALVLK